MVRAHAVGADLSVSHLFSSFSNPTLKPGNISVPAAPRFASAAPVLTPWPQRGSALLERRMAYYSTSLTSTQLKMDAVSRGFTESVNDGSALVFVLGAGALLRNVRLGFTMGEGIFAGLMNTSAPARVASSTLGTLALVGCGENNDMTNYDSRDAGTSDAGVNDGGGDAFINHPPILEVIDISSLEPIASISGKEGENINIILRGHDDDRNDVLTYDMESLGNPPTGSRVDTFNNSMEPSYAIFHWKPSYQQAGHYSLRFKVKDSHGASAYADIQIDVAHSNLDSDGDGWIDSKDCAPNDAHKFPLHDDPYSVTDNNIQNGEYTICPGTYRAVNLIGDNAIIHGENVTLEGNLVQMSAITQSNIAKASTYTGFTIKNYQGDNGAIYVLNNNGNTFKNITIQNVNLGIRIRNSDNNLIQGLKMFGVEVLGVSIEGSSPANNSSDNNIIENCEMHANFNSNNDGIVVFTGWSNVIRSNLISGFDNNILLGFAYLVGNENFRAYLNKVEGNTLVGASNMGIGLLQAGGNILSGNQIENNSIGINFYSCKDPVNTFVGNNFMGNGFSYRLEPNGGCDDDFTNFTNPSNNNRY